MCRQGAPGPLKLAQSGSQSPLRDGIAMVPEAEGTAGESGWQSSTDTN